MATSRPKLWRNSVIAAAVETTTGTAAALSGTNAFYAINPKLTPDAKITKRPMPGYMGTIAGIPGASSGKATIPCELQGSGSGTDGSLFTALLLGCGFSVSSHVYSPTSQPLTTLTIGQYVDGELIKITGAMGSAKIHAKVGEPVMVDFDFTGVWTSGSQSDTANVAVTELSTLPPRFAGATITVGGTAYLISEFELTIATEVVLRPDPATTSGYLAATIKNRAITLKLDPEAQPVATQDWLATYDAGTLLAFSCAIGSVQYNTITIAAPAMQLSKRPGFTDRDGIVAVDLEFDCQAVSGDDELTITTS